MPFSAALAYSRVLERREDGKLGASTQTGSFHRLPARLRQTLVAKGLDILMHNGLAGKLRDHQLQLPCRNELLTSSSEDSDKERVAIDGSNIYAGSTERPSLRIPPPVPLDAEQLVAPQTVSVLAAQLVRQQYDWYPASVQWQHPKNMPPEDMDAIFDAITCQMPSSGLKMWIDEVSHAMRHAIPAHVLSASAVANARAVRTRAAALTLPASTAVGPIPGDLRPLSTL
jgi:hypothetical protein